MNDKIKIGLPMEYEDDKNIIRTGLWLKEYEVEALEKRLNKCNQLQSNWNSLREWIIKQREEYIPTDRYVDGTFDTIDEILDKMNELEGVDK
jgi:hypothetical protein